MKKLICSVVILFLISVVVAQDVSEEDTGILPDSLFYGVKLFGERLGLALTFDKQRKAEKRILHAELRLKEMQIMLERGKIESAEKAQRHHERLLGKLEEIEIEDPIRASRIEERLERHDERLDRIKARAEKRVDLNVEKRERIKIMLDKVEIRSEKTRQFAVRPITRSEKLRKANKSKQAIGIRTLTNVRERLKQKPESLKEKLIGEGCGTVSPDSRSECCEKKGYDRWDEDSDECVRIG